MKLVKKAEKDLRKFDNIFFPSLVIFIKVITDFHVLYKLKSDT